ncbi:MAG: Nramp family divalent metal transporter [Patescibacteria group bacterium]
MDSLKKLWRSIGPGFITGASDDDPSGIATYVIAGARFGLNMLWTAVFLFPFMIVVQEMSGRIGMVSGKGLIKNMRSHYPRFLLLVITLFFVGANIVNIGADLSGMSAAFQLVAPSFPPMLFGLGISLALIVLLILFSYRKIASFLKWIALALVAYILAALLVDQDWSQVFYRTFIPHIELSKEFLLILIAVVGTTISPYLFFWQASEEVEEEKMIHHRRPSAFIMRREVKAMNHDTVTGMFFSNLIMYSMIALSSATLFRNGIADVTTIDQIASVLKPLAGSYSTELFLIGILASGLLAIPVLAGSAAYALAELFGWKEGMNKRLGQAPQFYVVIALATMAGLALVAIGINPMQALLYTAVILGFLSPILVALLLHMANQKSIMGTFTNGIISNSMGILLLLVMLASVGALIIL